MRIPLDPAQAFVVAPLTTQAGTDATLARALAVWEHASPATSGPSDVRPPATMGAP